MTTNEGKNDVFDDIQELLDQLGETIKSEHTDYDEHARDPRWEFYGKLLTIQRKATKLNLERISQENRAVRAEDLAQKMAKQADRYLGQSMEWRRLAWMAQAGRRKARHELVSSEVVCGQEMHRFKMQAETSRRKVEVLQDKLYDSHEDRGNDKGQSDGRGCWYYTPDRRRILQPRACEDCQAAHKRRNDG
jgi:hypothetical protein